MIFVGEFQQQTHFFTDFPPLFLLVKPVGETPGECYARGHESTLTDGARAFPRSRGFWRSKWPGNPNFLSEGDL